MVNLLIESLLLSLGINLALFLVAYRLKSDKLTDVSYALSFIVLAAVAFWRSGADIGHVILMTMVAVWAARLGGFLLLRIMKTGKDRRFDGVRENFRKFGAFWLGQAVTVWVLMIPSIMVFHAAVDLSWLGAVGCFVWAAGFLIESLADYQKYAFSRNPKNKDAWIESGVWRYSRHPNYFGEILAWVGVYIFALQALTPVQSLVGLVSPAVVAILLLFVSGIPPLEKLANKRWGNVEAYRDYKKRTSILIPLPVRHK